MDIEDKVALITGGSRGLGKAISIALAEKGADIAINFRSNWEAAEEAKTEVEKTGREAILYQADVSNYEEVKKMAEEILDDFGSIDILVNNAGVTGKHSSFDEIDVEEWRWVIDVNLSGTFNCCKAVVPLMGEGKIVNISSIAGKNGGTVGSHYGASKAGIIGLTFALASELAPDIWVNAVAPGPVETELLSESVKERCSKLTPFGRVAKPGEVAHSVVFLIENDYISGEVIDINAARYMD